MINWFIRDLSNQLQEQFEGGSKEDQNSLGIAFTEFEQQVGIWRKESLAEVTTRSWQKLKSFSLICRKPNQKILQLRWNFEEFEVHLNQIKEMVPVNNYYLKILVDESFEEHDHPFLSEERVYLVTKSLTIDLRACATLPRNPEQICEHSKH